MLIKYKCKETFYLRKYDNNLKVIEGEYFPVVKGSYWLEDTERQDFLAKKYNTVLLGSIDINEKQWIDIKRTALKRFFEHLN